MIAEGEMFVDFIVLHILCFYISSVYISMHFMACMFHALVFLFIIEHVVAPWNYVMYCSMT